MNLFKIFSTLNVFQTETADHHKEIYIEFFGCPGKE